LISARVAILEAPRKLNFKVEEINADALGETEILAETIVSAISPGTELAAYSGAPALRSGVTYPRLLGYCNVARVIKCGAAVLDIKPGSRILSFTSHRSHFRIEMNHVLMVVPDDVSSDDAVCAYLFHLGYSSILRTDVRAGSEVVVIGMGVLGLTTVALASLAGARVFAVSDHDLPRSKAMSYGAVSCSSRVEFPKLMNSVGTRRAQVVITTSNSWSDWRLALEAAGEQGTIGVLGFPGRQEESVPFNPLDSRHFYARQLSIVAVGASPEAPDSRGFLPFNERGNLRRLVGWMADGRLRPAELISGRFPGSELAIAYDSLLSRKGSPLTYLLDWNAE
jgi:threonine dehydrogenase-like Zn-dependent dehydrogenase